MNSIFKVMALVCLFAAHGVAHSHAVTWKSLDDALQEAKASGRPIALVVQDGYCGAGCDALVDDFEKDPELASVGRQFILAKADSEGGHARKVCHRLGVLMARTYLITLDPNGAETSRTVELQGRTIATEQATSQLRKTLKEAPRGLRDIALLRHLLGSKCPTTRLDGATLLAQRGVEAAPTTMRLASLLSDTATNPLLAARSEVLESAPDQPGTVWMSGARTVARASARALAAIGPAAKAAIPELLMLAKKDEAPLAARQQAMVALSRIDVGGTRSTATLIDLLDAPSRAVSLTSIIVLRRLGPAAKDALPALREQIAKSEDSEVSSHLERAIAAITG